MQEQLRPPQLGFRIFSFPLLSWSFSLASFPSLQRVCVREWAGCERTELAKKLMGAPLSLLQRLRVRGRETPFLMGRITRFLLLYSLFLSRGQKQRSISSDQTNFRIGNAAWGILFFLPLATYCTCRVILLHGLFFRQHVGKPFGQDGVVTPSAHLLLPRFCSLSLKDSRILTTHCLSLSQLFFLGNSLFEQLRLIYSAAFF